MYYVYVLQAGNAPERFYTGLTDDLRTRVQMHNAGRVRYTAKSKPWHLKTYIAFNNRTRAAEFERYLKRPRIRKKTSLNPTAVPDQPGSDLKLKI